MNMSGMGYGNMSVASVNNWMVPGASDRWTKIPTNAMIRTTSENVSTSNPTDMYERTVISSTSPPVIATEINQNHSRLRSLLTRPKVREPRPSKEILKGLLKAPSATTQANTESNYLLKGLLSSGVKQQDDLLLDSLGFQSPPTCDPTSPQTSRSSPAFSQNSPICDTSPLSYGNSPSPTGSSKRSADDDIYIERQIIKKKCYSPPSFHSLPSSSAKTSGREGTSGSTLCEKNKMLASLLATQPTTPATIPPLPQSVLMATPQERLPRLPPPRARPRQNSAAALWSGGTIKLNDQNSPPLVTSPTVEEYLPSIPSATVRQNPAETFPVNTQACNPVSVHSSPEVENCYQNTQQINQAIDQRQCAVNQQMPYPCNQEESWPNYCGQQGLTATPGPQSNSVWHEQVPVQRKLAFQNSEEAVTQSSDYNAATGSHYNTNYYSYEYYNQLQMRQGQNNNNAQLFLLQQQQLLIQQQQQQRYCTLQKGYFNMQCQGTELQMTGWTGYSREQMLFNNETLRQNYRNYQETGNSFQEYWDMQNSDPEPRHQVTGYNQNRGQTVSERKYLREGTADSTAPLELPSRLPETEEVSSASHTLRNGELGEMQETLSKNPNFASKNDELQFFGENDNDLSRILDDILDDENLGKIIQDPRRQQRNNIVSIPTNAHAVQPTIFSYNNCNNYDAQSCV